MTRTIWVFILTLAASASMLCAAVLDVTRFGATPNDSTDDTAAIQRAINASAIGDTISFPSGEYRLSNTLTFKSDRSYSAQASVSLKQLVRNTFIAATERDHGQNVTLSGLTFDGGGIIYAGSGNVPAQSILITNCTFENITCTTYPMNSAIYIPIGGIHCDIVANTFTNIMGDNAICAWKLASCSITDNYFDTVNEGAHINDNCLNLIVARNTGVRMHRMGFEFQGGGFTNFIVEDNHFSHWSAPFMDSFGLSIANAGFHIIVRYNTILGRPPTSGTWTDRYGYGIEVGNDDATVDNFIEGFFWYGIIVGVAHAVVTNNVLRGPTNGSYQQPSQSAFEPGGDPATAMVTNNLHVATASFIENPDRLRTNAIRPTRVDLAWADNSTNETGFKVERRLPGGRYAVIATLDANITSFSDLTTTPNTHYIYRIHAFNSLDETYSPVLLVTTPL